MPKAIVLLIAFFSLLQGAPITYTFEQLGSGSLGGTPFTDAQVTLVLTGDTSAIQDGGGGLYRNPGSATVTVAGLGTASFTIPVRVFAYNPNRATGFSRVSNGQDLLDVVFVSALSSYTLDSAIGPVTGAPGGNPSAAFATTAGDFILSSSLTSNRETTFTASLGSNVPEPASIGLVALGIGALMLRRRR